MGEHSNVSKAIDLLTRHGLPETRVVTQGPEYNRSISLWNASVTLRPALIVLCETKEDVQAAVRTAQTCKLTLSVRSGGHSAGRCISGQMVLDLTRMNHVTPHENKLIVGGGALNVDVARAAASIHRLAVTGIVGTVGFAGLATGGGYGHICGKYGMASDSIVGAEVVTHTGDILRAEEHPDLFWALRGGGCNFGVVTSLTIRTYPDELFFGIISYPWDQAKQVCEAYNAYKWPDEATVTPMFTPDLCFRFAFAFCGDVEHAKSVFEDVKRFGQPSFAQMSAQTMEQVLIETEKRLMSGIHHFTRTFTLPRLEPEAVDLIMSAMENRSSPMSWIGSHPLRGAPTRLPVESTAFGCRTPHIMFGIYTAWKPGPPEAHQRWADELAARLKPYTLPYSYPNYLAGGTPQEVQQSYGPNGQRLKEVKRTYDPDNVFKALSL